MLFRSAKHETAVCKNKSFYELLDYLLTEGMILVRHYKKFRDASIAKAMQLLENNPQMKASWNNLPKEVKEQRLIELYCKKGNGHLVPYLQQHVFPTIR